MIGISRIAVKDHISASRMLINALSVFFHAVFCTRIAPTTSSNLPPCTVGHQFLGPCNSKRDAKSHSKSEDSGMNCFLDFGFERVELKCLLLKCFNTAFSVSVMISRKGDDLVYKVGYVIRYFNFYGGKD